MARSDITWKRPSSEGEIVEVNARQVGDQWTFFTRARRYDQWQTAPTPPLEDWLTLRDAIRRRIGRASLRPEELGRVEKVIRERFPEADF